MVRVYVGEISCTKTKFLLGRVLGNIHPHSLLSLLKNSINKWLQALLLGFAGAHTIGSAHCSAFSDRFQEDSKGKFTLIDSSLDSMYADELMKKCPAGANASITVNNDPETSSTFDNQYYQNLIAHKGLFQSDSILLEDERTRKQVEEYANDQERFFESWGQSFLKLTSIGVKTGEAGEIRQSCSVING